MYIQQLLKRVKILEAPTLKVQEFSKGPGRLIE